MSREVARGGIDYPRTHAELLAAFQDEAATFDFLEWLRWRDGLVRPACDERRG
jgi:hypothetical protein